MTDDQQEREKADYTMGIRLTEHERREFQAQSDAEGFRTVSEWVRVTLKRAVRQAAAEPVGSPR